MNASLLCYAKHKPYYDATKATKIIQENLEWCTPNSLVLKIQALYPSVTANQVHTKVEGSILTLDIKFCRSS